jgi:hypothetical protein
MLGIPELSPLVRTSFDAADGTNLVDHTGEMGSATQWTMHPSSGAGNEGGCKISSGRIYGAINGWMGLLSWRPPKPDYRVFGVFYVASVVNNASITARHDETANTFYDLVFDQTTAGWLLRKRVAGTFTTLDTRVTSMVAGSVKLAWLEVSGSSIRGFVEGVEVVRATDSAITGAGRAGVRFLGTNTSTTGIHLADFATELEPRPRIWIPAGTAAGPTTHFGAASLALNFNVAAAGQRTRLGAVVLPLSFNIFTQAAGVVTHFGASATGLTFAFATQGRRTALGSTLVPLVFVATTAGKRTRFGVVALPLELAIRVAAAGFNVPGSVVITDLSSGASASSTDVSSDASVSVTDTTA